MGEQTFGCGPGLAVDAETHERVSDNEWTRRYWEAVFESQNCREWSGRAKWHQKAADAAAAMEARYARG